MLRLLKSINRVLDKRFLNLAIIKEDIDPDSGMEFFNIQFFLKNYQTNKNYEINVCKSYDYKNKFDLYKMDTSTGQLTSQHYENISREEVIDTINMIFILEID